MRERDYIDNYEVPRETDNSSAVLGNEGTAMAKLFVMDYSGHTTVDFDKCDPQRLKDAEQKLIECLKSGGVAATRKVGERDYTAIKDPAQMQDETLLRPQMKGG